MLSNTVNKDAFFATIIGFVVGLLITTGILAGPGVLKKFPKIDFHLPSLLSFMSGKTPNKIPESNVQKSNNTITFSIQSPIDGSIAQSATILVSGTAKPGNTMVIGGPSDETITTVSNKGTFAGNISLSEGVNDILVSELTSGVVNEKRIRVYFTEEKL